MMKKSRFTDGERFRALSFLSKHIGRHRAVSMHIFFEHVFEERPKSQINGTRKLRSLITELRALGEPICSTTDGYYLAAAGSERDDYCRRMTGQAIHKLLIVSRLKKISIQTICSQLEPDLNIDMVPSEA